MTCKEKLQLMHPEFSYDDVLSHCPYDFDIMDKPEYCGPMTACDKCWNREIPGSESDNLTETKSDDITKTKYKIFFGTHDFNGAVSADDLLNQWIDEHPGVQYSFLGYQHTRYGDHSILICYEEE